MVANLVLHDVVGSHEQYQKQIIVVTKALSFVFYAILASWSIWNTAFNQYGGIGFNM